MVLTALTVACMMTTAMCATVHSKVCKAGGVDEVRFNVTVDEFSEYVNPVFLVRPHAMYLFFMFFDDHTHPCCS